MNYQEAIAYIQSFPDMERATYGARGPTMGLPSMKDLLSRMGNPQLSCKTIHVAGSKGKGSTAMMISRILDEAGLNTALYTSPHLHDYCERIAFGSKPVAKERFAKGLAEIRPMIDAEKAAGNTSISTFGILTALFFHLVSKSSPAVDFQIVEVGLGGRYDVTNVFAAKELAVITPISLEHVEILGSSPTEIATNKAGIITPRCTAVLAPQKDKGASTAVGRRCREVHADFIEVGRTCKVRVINQNLAGQSFAIETQSESFQFELPLIGSHQVSNAATAVASVFALKEHGVSVTAEQIQAGLKKTTVPGRMQVLSGIKDGHKSGGPIILVDAAHNHESANALADTLKQVFGVESCVFVLGLNTDKNISAIWKELLGLSRICVATKSKNARSMDPRDIGEVVSTFGLTDESVILTECVTEAIDKAVEVAKDGEIICVTGSMYVVGEAREHVLKDRAWDLVATK
ncbi:MAG: hypothetical protein K8F91_02070 [Candidatus Obscuribacterales bacterium]|nr:hypothetical protein [Candidatus Obscuribacterales bacterium]